MVEQLTLNQLVPGSSPGGRTPLRESFAEKFIKSQNSRYCTFTALLRATQILPFRDHTPPPRQLSSGFAPNPPCAPNPPSAFCPKSPSQPKSSESPFPQARGFRGGAAARLSPRGSASLAGAKGVRGER